MPKHTTGPWHTPGEPMYLGRKPMVYRAFGIGNGAEHVGYASITGCVSQDQALANARLIAAAPELLDACKRAFRNLEFSEAYDVVDALKAAIEKAEAK